MGSPLCPTHRPPPSPFPLPFPVSPFPFPPSPFPLRSSSLLPTTTICRRSHRPRARSSKRSRRRAAPPARAKRTTSDSWCGARRPRLGRMYNDFDISFAHFSPISVLHATPPHAVWYVLLRARACCMLIGACNPISCPVHVHVLFFFLSPRYRMGPAKRLSAQRRTRMCSPSARQPQG